MIDTNIKNMKWSMVHRFNFNVENIKNEIIEYSNEWNLDTTRQNLYKTHKNTVMYQLKFMDYDWVPENKDLSYNVNELKTTEAKTEYNNIIKTLEQFYNGVVVRSELVGLMPNSIVRKHIDEGNMFKFSKRCHIPIITNENVYFTVLNNTINMKEGGCYEINNAMPHGVENKSNVLRVHLILDIIEKKYFI